MIKRELGNKIYDWRIIMVRELGPYNSWFMCLCVCLSVCPQLFCEQLFLEMAEGIRTKFYEAIPENISVLG